MNELVFARLKIRIFLRGNGVDWNGINGVWHDNQKPPVSELNVNRLDRQAANCRPTVDTLARQEALGKFCKYRNRFARLQDEMTLRAKDFVGGSLQAFESDG